PTALAAGAALLPGLACGGWGPQRGVHPQTTDDLDVRRALLQDGAPRVGAVAHDIDRLLRCPPGYLGNQLAHELQLGGPRRVSKSGLGRLAPPAAPGAGGSIGSPPALGADKEP